MLMMICPKAHQLIAAAGYALQTTQLFQVDATAPTIAMTSFLVGERRVTAVFYGSDASALSFRCDMPIELRSGNR